MTVEQLSLDSAPVVDMPKCPPTLDERYRRWLDDNPHALAEVARTTRELRKAVGREPTIAQVWEELRHRVLTRGGTYRWDNSWRAMAARDVMARYRDLRGVFRLRERTAR